MPTLEEIAAAASAIQIEISAKAAELDALQKSAKAAKDLDDLADAIELKGNCTIGQGGIRTQINGAGAVGQIVGYLRARAAAVRDGITLPTVEP